MRPQKAWKLAPLVGFFLVAAGVQAAPCPASATALCLAGQRFKVEVQWKDFQGNTGKGQAVGLTPDTGYFWFFTDNNIELVVKVLDARSFNNYFWVFFGALSNVEYTLTVTDTATGRTKSYVNPSGQFASVGDTAAFAGATAGVAATHETVAAEGTPTPPRSLEAIQRFIGAAEVKSAPEASAKKAAAFTPCPGPSTSLYLSNCRFQLEVQWSDSQGGTGAGQAVQLTNDTGYFWFFTDNNVELIVKVLDARAFNGRFWVFFGALSNVEYSLHVKDTISGALHIYRNPSGDFASVGDTSAFRGGYGVTVSSDSGRAVSGAISAASGGTLSATAANGTVFTLEVPPGALLSDKTVTMTPVSAIGGLPFSGGLVAGVNLEPSGLYLMTGARLTIHTSSPISQAEETTFAWNGSGEDFFLYPPAAAKGDLQMYVLHFGGYGVGRGSDAERQTQAGKEPVADDDRLSHRIALFLRKGRAEALSGTAVGILSVATIGDWARDLRLALDESYAGDGGLRDQMQGTIGYPDQVVSLIVQVQTWQSNVELNLGSLETVFPGRRAEIQTLFEKMLRQALQLIHARCVADVTQIRQLPRILRVIQTLGLNLSKEATEALKCLTFRLTFDSTIVAVASDGGLSVATTHSVKATVPLRFPVQSEGAISVTYISVTGQPSECTPTYGFDGSSTFKAVLDLGADLEKFSGAAEITLLYDPGTPPSTLTITCQAPGVPSITQVIRDYWRGSYHIFHSDEFENGFYTASGWTATGGKDPWATRGYVKPKTVGDVMFIETTFLKIAHTPE